MTTMLAILRKVPSLFLHNERVADTDNCESTSSISRTRLAFDCKLCSKGICGAVPSPSLLLRFLLSWKHKLWQCASQPLHCVICTHCIHASMLCSAASVRGLSRAPGPTANEVSQTPTQEGVLGEVCCSFYYMQSIITLSAMNNLRL